MVDRLPGECSDFLPEQWLVDSGADIKICFNVDLFSYIGPSDVDKCAPVPIVGGVNDLVDGYSYVVIHTYIYTPIGSTSMTILGCGVVKMCVGHYVDQAGLSHPIDLEIENVYWVPWCLMNVLATPCLAEQHICLYTVPPGN